MYNYNQQKKLWKLRKLYQQKFYQSTQICLFFGRRSLLQKSGRQKPTKTKKNIETFVNHHYIKSVFLVHHYYDKNQTFDVLILPMASKKITTSTIKNIIYLWRITNGHQGLWGVRLGSIRLG